MALTCDYCQRKIHPLLTETEKDPHLLHQQFSSPELSAHLDGRSICADCNTEVEELLSEAVPTEENLPVGVPGTIDQMDTCGLCGGDLDFPITGVMWGHEGSNPRDHHFAFCESCGTVFEKFLNDVPEQSYSGEYAIGPPSIGWVGHLFVRERLRRIRIGQTHNTVATFRAAIESDIHREDAIGEVYENISSEVLKHRNVTAPGRVAVEIGLNPHGVATVYRDVEDPAESIQPFAEGVAQGDMPIIRLDFERKTLRRGAPLSEFTSSLAYSVESAENEAAHHLEQADQRIDAIIHDLKSNRSDSWEALCEASWPTLLHEIGESKLE